MIWKVLVESVPWSEVRSALGGSEFAPDAMHDLLHATSEREALDAYWRLDNRVVPQGTLFESARWVIGPLLTGLATERPPFVREQVVDLLVEIALGTPAEPTEPPLDRLCYNELRNGLWTIYALLDDDVPMVRLGALELLNVAEPDRSRFALVVERMKADSDSRVVELAHVFAP